MGFRLTDHLWHIIINCPQIKAMQELSSRMASFSSMVMRFRLTNRLPHILTHWLPIKAMRMPGAVVTRWLLGEIGTE
jgi:hypothetical protein